MKVVLKAGRSLFARMLIIAQRRLLNIPKVFQYGLGPLPWSLATGDGRLYKTPKSKLLQLLEHGTEPAENVPLRAAVIVDAMAVLQSLTKPAPTFGVGASQIFGILAGDLRVAGSRVDFVIDRYPEYSIKTCERQQRASQHGTMRIQILSAAQKTPRQWKKYLSNPQNKEDLLHFFASEWPQQTYAASALVGGNKVIFVTDKDVCYRLTHENDENMRSEQVLALSCRHEEVDTRLSCSTRCPLRI